MIREKYFEKQIVSQINFLIIKKVQLLLETCNFLLKIKPSTFY